MTSRDSLNERRIGQCAALLVTSVCLVSLSLCQWLPLAVAHDPAAQEGSAQGGSAQAPATLDQRLLEGLPVVPPTAEHPAAKTPTDPPAVSGSPPPALVDPSSAGSDAPAENPLQLIGRRMQQVHQRLSERDVSPDTQQTQQRIIAELDELIAALNTQQQSTVQQKQQQRKSTPRNGSSEDKGGQQAARDGSQQTGSEPAIAEETSAMRQASGEVWGHLPERLRRQLQSSGAIEFLPKYRQLIEDYYQRLSEERDTRQ